MTWGRSKTLRGQISNQSPNYRRVFSSLRSALGLCILLAAAWQPREVSAQALEPRAYANVPVGLNFLLAGLAYGEGGVPLDPSAPLEDARVETRTGILAYARSLDIRGQSGTLSFLLPYSRVAGSATIDGERRSRTVIGVGDPVVRFTFNILGAPALKLKD